MKECETVMIVNADARHGFMVVNKEDTLEGGPHHGAKLFKSPEKGKKS